MTGGRETLADPNDNDSSTTPLIVVAPPPRPNRIPAAHERVRHGINSVWVHNAHRGSGIFSE